MDLSSTFLVDTPVLGRCLSVVRKRESTECGQEWNVALDRQGFIHMLALRPPLRRIRLIVGVTRVVSAEGEGTR